MEVYGRADGKRLAHATGFQGPADAVELPGGALIVIEPDGDVIELKGEAKRTVAAGLKLPTSLARAPDGTLYVIEAGANQLSRLDLASGTATPVATGFKRAKAVAVGPSGKPVVLDLGERSVVEVDPKTGAKTVVARDLPLGLLGGPVPLGAGVAVGGKGAIYVASDVENAIYRITR